MVDYLDEISVEELQDALSTAWRQKANRRLLATIAYENGVIRSELAEWSTFSGEQSTANSSDSTPTRISSTL